MKQQKMLLTKQKEGFYDHKYGDAHGYTGVLP